jgi:hypothetical protein
VKCAIEQKVIPIRKSECASQSYSLIFYVLIFSFWHFRQSEKVLILLLNRGDSGIQQVNDSPLKTYLFNGLLKVPKRENIPLAFFYTKWSHLGMWLKDSKKNRFFNQLTPDFYGFWLFAAYWVWGEKKIYARPKLKVGGGCFVGPISMLTMCFLILLWMFKNSKKSSFFKCTLSMRAKIFTAYLVCKQ